MPARSTSPAITDDAAGAVVARNRSVYASWLTENQPIRIKEGGDRSRPEQSGDRIMNLWTKPIVAAALFAAPLLAFSAPAQAGIGGLLVAPARIVLDGRKGAGSILNNIGKEPATYRISGAFRRMDGNGPRDE